jgi:CTP synthase
MKGASMRLGSYPCDIERSTLAFEAYGEKQISERHRHRYEFNNFYKDKLTGKGLVVSGVCPQGALVEMVELKKHPWFLGCQFHPEFKSRPHQPHPLFTRFIKSACEYGMRRQWTGKSEKAPDASAAEPASGRSEATKVKTK